MPTASDGTVYTTLARDNGTYAVEVTGVGELPDLVEGFKTRSEAEQWIYDNSTIQESRQDFSMPPYAGPRQSTPGVQPERKRH
jgi:hypothetical protein